MRAGRRKLNCFNLAALIFFGFLSFPYCAAAEKVSQEDPDFFGNGLDASFKFIPSRSIKDKTGKCRIFESAVEYGREIKLMGKLPVEVSLEAGYIGINNTSEFELPAKLTDTGLDIETIMPFFTLDKLYFGLGLNPSFYGDNWDFESRDFRFLSRYFLIYRLNEKWSFWGGLGVFPGYQDKLVPGFGFIFKPNGRLSVNFIADNPNISYQINKKLSVFAEGNLSLIEYKVDRDSSSNVPLRYTEANLGAGIKYSFNDFIENSLAIGAVFENRIKYRDTADKAVIKDGFYTEYRITLQI